MHRHHHIKSGLKFFSGGSSTSSQSSSLSNIEFQNADNNLNDKANADTADTETWLSSESETNKAKLDCWSDQQIQVL